MSEAIIGKKTILFPAQRADLDYFIDLYQQHMGQIECFNKADDRILMKRNLINRMESGSLRIWLGVTKQGKGSRKMGFIYATEIQSHKMNVHGMIDNIYLKDLAKQMIQRYTYTEDAYKTFIDYCFDELKMERIETAIKRDNSLAFRLDKRVGFKVEGILRRYIKEENGYSDLVLMSILKDERLKSSPEINDKTEQPLSEVKK